MTFLTVWNAKDKKKLPRTIFLGYLSPALLILSHVLRIILEMKRCVLLLITDSFYESYNKKVAVIKLPYERTNEGVLRGPRGPKNLGEVGV